LVAVKESKQPEKGSDALKIIISRKGSDSKNGGMASPILPCGCLCPIPIPYASGGLSYSKIWFGKQTLQEICTQLNPKREIVNEVAHLDPDLRFESLEDRPDGWRPAFGQSGSSAGHFHKQGAGREGDLFLYFGWFRGTTVENGKLAFSPNVVHGRHIIYGWLEVGKVFDVNKQQPSGDLLFLEHHAHVRFVRGKGPNFRNLIYVGSGTGLKAGLFTKYSDRLSLTSVEEPRCIRSKWEIPSIFEPLLSEGDLSHHRTLKGKLERRPDGIVFRSASIGQEFVFDGGVSRPKRPLCRPRQVGSG
jgi:hypothetical protein